MRSVFPFRVVMTAAILLAGSGAASAQPSGGGSLQIAPGAILVDDSTGLTHGFQLQAQESLNAGFGSVLLTLGGGAVQVCTVRGGGGLLLNQPVPTPICATAGGQAVRIDKCTATIEAHVSVHSDAPHTTYLGSATIDIRFQKTNAPGSDGELEVTIHTPKKQIHLKGKIAGMVTMPTCPL